MTRVYRPPKYPTVYRVAAVPSLFRGHEGVIRYFCTEKRAKRWMRRYVKDHPYAQAVLYHKPRRKVFTWTAEARSSKT